MTHVPADRPTDSTFFPRWPILLAIVVSLCGCGTSQMTNTQRSATEQLLISDATDRAVDRFNFEVLHGRKVYLDTEYFPKTVADQSYVVSTLRQKILAGGCVLTEKKEEADYVIEVRAGTVGTDSNQVVFGIPAVSVPAGLATGGMAPVGMPSIPEIPFIKKTKQQAVVKLGLFAYNRSTGRALWQSGVDPVVSTSSNTWVFGAGPFQRGSIYETTKFAGSDMSVPPLPGEEEIPEEIAVTRQALFNEALLPFDPSIQPAGHEEEAKPDAEKGTDAKPADAQTPATQTADAPAPDTKTETPPATAVPAPPASASPAGTPAPGGPKTPEATEMSPPPASAEPARLSEAATDEANPLRGDMQNSP